MTPPERSETPERREAPERREDRMDIEKAKEILLAEVYLEKASDPLCRAEAQGFLAGHSSRDAEVEELNLENDDLRSIYREMAQRMSAYRQVAISERSRFMSDDWPSDSDHEKAESFVDAEAAKLLPQHSEPKTDMTQGIGGKD